MNKRKLIKSQSFHKAEDTVNRTKWQPTDWEKIFFTKRLLFNIYKELKKLDSRESNNPIEKMGYRAKQRILN